MILSNNKIIRKGRLLTCLRRQAGFTLVELLVTISIFVILTGIVLFNQKSFDGTILLKNLTYDIALTIRQAQIYGVNIKESGFSGNFSSYGIYFDLNGIGKNNFIFFADNGGPVGVDDVPTTNPDKKFNGNISCISGDIECVQKYSIKKSFFISKICAGDGSSICNTPSNGQLTLYFQRPNPDALIFLDNDVSTSKKYAEITISSNDGSASSTVVVTSVGQIYVKK